MTTLRFFAATGDGIARVTCENGRCEVRMGLEGSGAQCVAADPHDPNRVFAGTFDNGLWRSRDGGESWTRVGDGAGPGNIPVGRIPSVAVSPSHRPGGRSAVFAGSEPSMLYRSEDDGETWAASPRLAELPSSGTWSFPPRPWTHHTRWIAPHHADPALIFVGIELGGVMRSRDGGETWEDRKPGSYHDSHAIVTHPTDPSKIYEAAGEGVALSTTEGDTWQPVDAGKTLRYTVGLAADPADPALWYVSAATGPRAAYSVEGAAGAAIYRKRGDEPWQHLGDNGGTGTGLPHPMPYMAIALLTFPERPKTLLAGLVNGELRLTEDAGETWRTLDAHLPHLAALSAA